MEQLLIITKVFGYIIIFEFFIFDLLLKCKLHFDMKRNNFPANLVDLKTFSIISDKPHIMSYFWSILV